MVWERCVARLEVMFDWCGRIIGGICLPDNDWISLEKAIGFMAREEERETFFVGQELDRAARRDFARIS